MLNTVNRHSRDSRIEFQKQGHRYKIDGSDEGYVSVTTLVHRYFPDFKPSLVIWKMMKSKNWEESKYYGKTKTEIKEDWNRLRVESSELGTRLHDQIEHYLLTGEEPEAVSSEFAYFLEWVKTVEGWKPYRTEMCVFDEAAKVAGSIDCLFVDVDGSYHLVDWKRSKQIKMANDFEKGFGPFEGLDNCNYVHYSLQLNIYKYILEKHYGIVVASMHFIVLHPNNEKCVDYLIEDRKDIVEKLWKEINNL